MIDALRIGKERWYGWRERSVNRRIFAALLTVGGLTAFGKLAAMVKELLVAHQFGTSDALDAFLIALLIPGFAIDVVAASFNAALIPTYIRVRERDGNEAAQRLFSGIVLFSLVLLAAVSLLLLFVEPWLLPILSSGFSAEKLELTRSLFYILLPLLALGGLATIWGAVLNAGERFALASVAPILTPVIAALALLIGGKTWGIFALAVGTLLGAALGLLLLAWGLRRQGMLLLPSWHGGDPAIRQVMQQYAPMIAGAMAMSSTGLVDQGMAAMLAPGSVSTLNYAYKLIALVVGLGSTALGTAVLPHFSRLVAQEAWDAIQHTLQTYVRLVVVITVPLTLVLGFFSESIVHVLFERGAFNTRDTQIVAQTQLFYLLQVPFYLLCTLYVRLISSLCANHILMWGAIINLLVNVVLNLIFIQWLGVAGIALSTSVVYMVSLLYLVVMLKRTLKRKSVA